MALRTPAQAKIPGIASGICSRCLGKPPTSPYPPDLPEDPVPVTDLEDLVDAVVAGVEWANRPARGLAARRVELRRCRLTGVELAEAMLSDVTFHDCRLDLVSLRIAKLERVVFRECRMAECDFYDASLTDVLFEGCELREATFSGVKLKRVELRGCDLSSLRGVEALRGARMPWNDVLENGPLFAAALGLEIVD
ncbi:MAG TPA: pentapeptide repeat-containing protein [Gaiellaceae bacterium]|nr:pentapeptide repeat-containing protein [Gaiellaceae bacterium]